MANLYPLKFYPQFIEKIWGGRKLKDILGKELPRNGKFGESWEISEVKGYVSVVKNGSLRKKTLTDCISLYKDELLGENVRNKYGDKFPLLIKFLDAQLDLSIQVHPDDALARSKGQEYGKSEMWYILQAEENASLFKGFKKNTDPQTFINCIENSSIDSILNTVNVENDDILYIPAGTIHNIGKGILLAEIQQSSDATYRIYDFERSGPDGKQRDLHLKDASEALNFNAIDRSKRTFKREINIRVKLVESEHFVTNRFSIKKEYNFIYPKKDSFRILICIKGNGILKGDFEPIEIKFGDTLLIPAVLNKLCIETDTGIEVLESQIP